MTAQCQTDESEGNIRNCRVLSVLRHRETWTSFYVITLRAGRHHVDASQSRGASLMHHGMWSGGCDRQSE